MFLWAAVEELHKLAVMDGPDPYLQTDINLGSISPMIILILRVRVGSK